MTRSEAFSYYVHKIRRITPGYECERCRGAGHYNYSNGRTWRRGGMATQAFQEDVCDHCWGSGQKDRPWTDIRAIEDKFKAWEEDQVIDYMHRRLGLNWQNFKFAWAELQRYADKQQRKRKLPEGAPVDAFWWGHTWHAVSSMIGKLLTHERRTNSSG